MRESPRLTATEIIDCKCIDKPNWENDRAIVDKATAEALKWVVDWLQVVAEQHQVYTPVLLSEMLEVKLKEIVG